MPVIKISHTSLEIPVVFHKNISVLDCRHISARRITSLSRSLASTFHDSSLSNS